MHASATLSLVSVAVPLLLGCGAALLRARARLRRDEAACRHARVAALEAQEVLIRRLRLTAHDLRGIGMSVQGYADHLATAGHPHATGIAVASADLLDLADDLQDLTLDPAAPRMVRDEEIPLGEAVDEAVARIAATILPGRRNVRVLPALRPVVLRADRRALRHALGRVLADAVRNTRHDDWIDIAAHREGDDFVLTVADEGRGTLAPDGGAARRDSRGIGLRLALARALVEAHGGRVVVEALTEVGCRVSLVLPAARVAGFSPPSRSCAAPVPAGGSAGR